MKHSFPIFSFILKQYLLLAECTDKGLVFSVGIFSIEDSILLILVVFKFSVFLIQFLQAYILTRIFPFQIEFQFSFP